jgi:hypothetical protein
MQESRACFKNELLRAKEDVLKVAQYRSLKETMSVWSLN